MASVSDIVRASVDESYTVDENGRLAYAAWNLPAKSRVQAELLLKAKGIFRGTTFIDIDGSAPDSTLKLDALSIERTNVEGLPNDLSWYEALAVYRPVTASRTKKGVEIEVDGPAVWSTDRSLTAEPADTDRAGHALTNTAGVPIEGAQVPRPSEFQIAEWIKSNANYFDAVTQSRKFTGKVNSSTFKGGGKRTVLCYGLLPEALDNDAYEGSGLVKFTARFEFAGERSIGRLVNLLVPVGGGKFKQTTVRKVPGFTSVFLSQGRFEKNPDFRIDRGDDSCESSRLRPILQCDSQGRKVPVSDPVLLDQNGRGPTTEVTSILYELIEEVDLNQLRI